jgi:UDP-glucuronate 4-epimerase
MAMFKFTRAILEGTPIQVYNHGDMSRDFTYIDDIVEGVARVLAVVPAPNPQWTPSHGAPDSSSAPYALYNIGHGSPVGLMDFIRAVEAATGKQAICDYQPMQPGDVAATYADVDSLINDVGYRPETSLEDGLARFVAWYREFYRI